MPFPKLDRTKVIMKPLSKRPNKKNIETDHVMPGHEPANMSVDSERIIAELARKVHKAISSGRPVMLTFGAHTIKNGLAPVLIELLNKGWVTHLATNGAGIIHDWEFAFQGETSEDVRTNVAVGEFGNWYETGFYINLALVIGAYRGLGYGESIGRMIHREQLQVPSKDELEKAAQINISSNPGFAAAALDLLSVVQQFDIRPGTMNIPHPFKHFSVQAKAFEMQTPFTGHPMFGHDIIYNCPLNLGSAIGRVAQHDFLSFAHSVSRISGGVYISLGSAVMSPMIFEKSMSMAQNLASQEGGTIDGHEIFVVDLAESRWDWSKGEPPEDNPDYYLRLNKTFSRMGGNMKYLTADNRDFLLTFCREMDRQ